MFCFYILISDAFIIFLYLLFFVKIVETIIYKISDYIISFELLFLSILCIAYYFELFRGKAVNNLKQSPSFWIVTALFFYAVIITPFFMLVTDEFMKNQRDIYNALFAVHYILFSFLFLAIIKAFLCRKPLTT
ncbi:MAG: hypothetical protein JWM28_1293 [Chitinophagaceae bacterium]|nr:hypothetical protein [Chitinophagaceae bacterium]